MNNNYTVYAHLTPDRKLYIGQTSRALEERWRNGDGYIDSPCFSKAIKKFGWSNIEHVVICENLSQEQANNLERWLIHKYRTQYSEFGFNMQAGGKQKRNEYVGDNAKLLNNTRKCKCAITGEWGTTDQFIKIGSKYYKSKEIYNQKLQETKTRSKLIKYICNSIMQYRANQKPSPYLYKRLNKLGNYGFENILELLITNKDKFDNISTKHFEDENHKIAYVFKVVENILKSQ